MKTVFDNRQVAHVWAQQNQSQGRSSNGQFYFRDRTIFSYRDSWPLATYATPNIVLINSTSYSVTTSKHLSFVRNALSSSVTKYHVSKNALDQYVQAWNDDFSHFISQVVRDCDQEYTNALNSAIKRKKLSLRASDISHAVNYIQNIITMLADLKFEIPSDITALQEKLLTDNDKLLTYHKQKLEAEKQEVERKKLEAEKERKNLISACLDDWYNMRSTQLLTDKGDYAIRNDNKIYMRINGDNIETSRGAYFPIEHAKKAFKMILQFKQYNPHGEVFDTGRGNKAIPLGHFKVDKIHPNGDVIAGCHFVEWDQIERLAIILKLYP